MMVADRATRDAAKLKREKDVPHTRQHTHKEDDEQLVHSVLCVLAQIAEHGAQQLNLKVKELQATVKLLEGQAGSSSSGWFQARLWWGNLGSNVRWLILLSPCVHSRHVGCAARAAAPQGRAG